MLKFAPSCLIPPIRRSFSYSRVKLSGHNKWSKIKQRKGANDAQKGVVFGKANRDIVMAVRSGGGVDPTKNLQLAAVLRRAREMDVPKENIEKALAKASQEKGQSGERFTYEALAFNSIGIIIECMTDNSNRTIHNLREILNDHGAHATPVKFMFKRQGYVTVGPKDNFITERQEELVSTALDSGANDFDTVTKSESDIPSFQFICEPDQLQSLALALSDKHSDHFEVLGADLRYTPLESTPELPFETENSLKALIEDLETNEDVLRVWTTLPDYN